MKLFELEQQKGFRSIGGIYGLESYAADYWRAAKEMIDSEQPFPTFPIVFLYRHALELMLKAILIEHDICFSERPELLLNRGHLLKKNRDKDFDYVKDLRSIVDKAGEFETGEPVVDVTPEKWTHLQSVLDEWKKHDPDGMAFRYSIDKKANALPTHDLIFDIKPFSQAMENVLEMLADIKSTLDHLRYQDILQKEGPLIIQQH